MERLKVVALISGGKDSLFSILHCIANGHDVVALANLHPPTHSDQATSEDLDSYMYQTIGHAVIPLYEKALGLPLFRQEINGTAVNLAKSYAPESNPDRSTVDETESLVPLLRRVMGAIPGVNAVSTGAILSDYQRTRVESVALRLGLTPLSYLWQYPHLSSHTQTSLLEDMATVGQDSRTIKVASGGLDERFLWKNVADPRNVAFLTAASERFGTYHDGAVLGEGGEYETLAVNGPPPLWKHCIQIPEIDREVVAGEAGSASIRIRNATLGTIDIAEPVQPRIPQLLDDRFVRVYESLVADSDEIANTEHTLMTQPLRADRNDAVPEDLIMVTDVIGHGKNAAEQMEDIMQAVNQTLSQRGGAISAIAYTSIVLRDMTDFPIINKVYGSYFQKPNPPARVTVACADVLPGGSFVSVSVTSMTNKGTHWRKGLHVQSRSYWAPANIGPYSQATSVPIDCNDDASPSIVYIAGQIPLIPATMQLDSCGGSGNRHNFLHQAILAIQHLHKVGNATSVLTWEAAIAFITTSPADDIKTKASLVRKIWISFHQESVDEILEDESEDVDLWDLRFGARRNPFGMQNTEQVVSSTSAKSCPPLWIIVADDLPRGASIEWAAYGCTSADVTGRPAIPHLSALLHQFASRIV